MRIYLIIIITLYMDSINMLRNITKTDAYIFNCNHNFITHPRCEAIF